MIRASKKRPWLMNGRCAMGRGPARPDLLASVAVATRSVLARIWWRSGDPVAGFVVQQRRRQPVALSPPDVAGDGPKMPEPAERAYASRT